MSPITLAFLTRFPSQAKADWLSPTRLLPWLRTAGACAAGIWMAGSSTAESSMVVMNVWRSPAHEAAPSLPGVAHRRYDGALPESAGHVLAEGAK